MMMLVGVIGLIVVGAAVVVVSRLRGSNGRNNTQDQGQKGVDPRLRGEDGPRRADGLRAEDGMRGEGVSMNMQDQNCDSALPPHDTMPIPKEAIRRVELENGLTMLLCKQGTAPKVLVQIAYDVGSSIEQEGERGLAHLLEHMIFKGTTKLKEGDVDAVARKYGADFNAFTSYDMTSYYFEADKNNWKHFVPVLADCMQNALFDDEHLSSEVKAVVQELRMYKDSDVHVMFEAAMARMFPANHPYHHPIIGYKEDLADISGERLKAFYNKYYHPSRAVLCIVGDIDLDDAEAEARAHFEGIQSQASEHQPNFVQVPAQLGAQSTTILRDVQHDKVALYWRIPGFDAKCDEIVSALDYLLGGSLSSRLHRELIDERKIASQVSVWADQMATSGIFMIFVDPKPGHTAACEQAAREVLMQVMEQGFTKKELYKMVKHRQRQYLQQMYNLQNFTYHWIESFFNTGETFDAFERVNRFARVTSDKLQAFVREHLDPRVANRMEINPLPEEKRPVWEAEQKRSEGYFAYLLDRHKRTAPLGTPEYVHTLPEPTPLTFSFPQPTEVAKQNETNLSVITYTQASVPLVSTVMMFKHAAYFARAKEGVAIDLMMSMLMEGAAGKTKQQLVDGFELHGAQYGFSSRGVSMTCGKGSVAEVLAHALSILRKPKFTQEALDKLRTIYIHSFEQKKDSPRDMAVRALRTAVYGEHHPYGWTFESMIVYLESLTLDNIKKLHDRYVRPDYFLVSSAGSCSPAENHELWDSLTRGWKPGGYTPPVCPEREQSEHDDIVIPMLRDQAVLMFGRASEIGLHDPENLLLDLLGTISFYSLGSRIYALRERTGLFYNAGGSWASDIHREKGFDYMMAILNPDNVEFATREMAAMVDELREKGVSTQEVAAARQIYLKDLIDYTASPRTIAACFANIETLGLGYDYYDKQLARVNAVTEKEISEVAATYVSMKKMIRICAGRKQ